LETETERYQELEGRVCSFSGIEQAQVNVEKQMVMLQNQIDQFKALTDFERDVDESEESVPLLELDKLRRLPPKPTNVAAIMEQQESEQAFLKSLRLPDTVAEIFRTLEKSLSRVSEHSPLAFSYERVQDLAWQKEYLSSFSDNFAKFTTRLLSVHEHSARTAQLHESLAQQNQLLFTENCALHKQLLQ